MERTAMKGGLLPQKKISKPTPKVPSTHRRFHKCPANPQSHVVTWNLK